MSTEENIELLETREETKKDIEANLGKEDKENQIRIGFHNQVQNTSQKIYLILCFFHMSTFKTDACVRPTANLLFKLGIHNYFFASFIQYILVSKSGFTK